MNNIVRETSSGKTVDQSSDNGRGEDETVRETNPQNRKDEETATQEVLGHETTGGEEEKVKRPTQFRLVMEVVPIFAAPPSYSFAHCISKDCKPSKGTARMFKDEFGRVDEMQDQKVDTGGVAILNLGQRVIYNLVTKEKHLNTSSYYFLLRALEAMRRDAMQRNVKHRNAKDRKRSGRARMETGEGTSSVGVQGHRHRDYCPH
jgi:hypothetical protein